MKRCLAFFAVSLATFVVATQASASTAQLGLTRRSNTPTVIQGGQDPVFAYVYNTAPTGSDILNYNVKANFPIPLGTPLSVSSTKIADGGTNYDAYRFTFDSSQVPVGNNVPVSVTGTDTVNGKSVTFSGGVNVLAHGVPALVLQGKHWCLLRPRSWLTKVILLRSKKPLPRPLLAEPSRRPAPIRSYLVIRHPVLPPPRWTWTAS